MVPRTHRSPLRKTDKAQRVPRCRDYKLSLEVQTLATVELETLATEEGQTPAAVDAQAQALVSKKEPISQSLGEIVGRYGGPAYMLLLFRTAELEGPAGIGAIHGLGYLGDVRAVQRLGSQ